MSEVKYQVFDDAPSLAATTGERCLELLSEALQARDDAHLVVTGGGILEDVMRSMRAAATRLDWSRVHVWWGDERFVAADSPERNDRAAFTALFEALPLDPARVHRMPSSEDAPDVDAAAASYIDELRAAAEDHDIPAFDVVLLGVGPDGHCASLFPGDAALERQEAAIGVRYSPKPPPERISLSFRALDAARNIWLIASGTGKADAVARAQRGEVPCGRPRGTETTVWWLDRDAASDLSQQP